MTTVRDWIKGKDVLVTGGFGFVGKGLIEKLLRTTEVNRIYLIIRGRRNLTPNERWKEVTKDMVFDKLRTENPDSLNKVKIIEGDLALPGLGLSLEDKKTLVNNVSIVFHAAACVRFDDPLANAILVNIRGTKELADLAKSMKKLECFQYVSTAFSNCNLNVDKIEEKIYHQDYDWKSLLKMAETCPVMINKLEKKIIGTHPNTYTFCKSNAELVLEDYQDSLPIVIFRPSVVVGSVRDPEPGWVDNFNGISGMSTACIAGILRVFRGSTHHRLDLVSIDMVVNGMIVTAWGASKKNKKEGLDVFNCTYADKMPASFGDILKIGFELNDQYPVDTNYWYPFLYMTENTFIYHFLFYLLQVIPACLLDLLMMLLGRKKMLLNISIKIYLANSSLLFFTSRTITFESKKIVEIYNRLPKEDEEVFVLDPAKIITLEEYSLIFIKGIKKFLLKEKDSDIDRFKVKLRRFYYLHVATKVLLLSSTTWLLLHYVKQLTGN